MTEGIEQPNQDKIRTLGEMDTYKYLRIFETDTINHVEMKEKGKRILPENEKKLLETKLHHRNLIKGIHTWAIKA